jgi:hypothetical protein
MPAVPAPPAPPLRRQALTHAERQLLVFELRRYWWWLESGRKRDRWLESGVARARDYTVPLVRGGRPTGSVAPVAALPDQDGPDAILVRLDAAIQALPEPARLLLYWKSHPPTLTNAAIAERFGCSERSVVHLWRHWSVHLVNELWPGASGGFARL